MLSCSEAYKAGDGTVFADGRFLIRDLEPFSHVRVKAYFALAGPDFDIMREYDLFADSLANFPDGDEITKKLFRNKGNIGVSLGGCGI